MFKTDPLAQARYDAMLAARTARLEAAFALAPNTGHKIGHSYK